MEPKKQQKKGGKKGKKNAEEEDNVDIFGHDGDNESKE